MGVCASKSAVELSETKAKPVLKVPLSSALQRPNVLSTPLLVTNVPELPPPKPPPEPKPPAPKKQVEVYYEYGYEYGEEEYDVEVEEDEAPMIPLR